MLRVVFEDNLMSEIVRECLIETGCKSRWWAKCMHIYICCIEKLKQAAYFYLIRSSMEYDGTVWEPYQNYNSDRVEGVQRRAARFVKSSYTQYSSVSDICLMRWGGRLFLKGDMRLDLFCFRQIGYTTSQYEQSFSHKTSSAWNGLTFAEAPSLAVFRSNFV